MRRINPFVAGILFSVAVFVICNCAGYVIVTVFAPGLLTGDQTSQVSPGSVPPSEADVVAFTTPSALEVEPPGTVQPLLLDTPIPLLPTVTAAPPDTVQLETPTSPPLATATLLPTNTPTPSVPLPTITPNELVVVSHKSYVDSLGWYHIVGEVQNNADVPVEFVEVVATLYDDTNSIIGTKLTFTAPDTIFPGGSAPFDIITLRRSQWEKIKEYSLNVKGDAAETLLQQNLIMLNQNSFLQDENLYVTGQVQNTGDSPALVKLIITLYDADRNVVNTNWSYADAGIISPNETSDFEVKIGHPSDPENYHFRIQIEEESIETD